MTAEVATTETPAADNAEAQSGDLVTMPRRDIEASANGTFDARWRFAANLAQADMLPKHLKQRPADVLYAMELADSLGVHHVQAFTDVHVVEGRPQASAELVRALILRDGHRLRISMQNDRCTIRAARRDDPEHWESFEYTLEDARVAGLTGKDVWKKHPRRMLLARATSEAKSAMFPDVARGIGVIGGEDDVAFAEPAAAAQAAPAKSLTDKVRAARQPAPQIEGDDPVNVNKETGEITAAVEVQDPPEPWSQADLATS